MKQIHKQILLWTGLALAVMAGAVWQFFPLKDAQKRIEGLPLYGPGFVGKSIPLSDWEKDFFQKVNILKRVYKVGDQHLFITALDGTNDRHAVHDPLYCFRGSGWDVVKQETLPLKRGGSVAWVTLQKGDEQKDAVYWFSDGNKHYDAPLSYWWQATLRRLTLGMSSPEPVLIVVQPISGTKIDWDKLMLRFPELLTI